MRVPGSPQYRLFVVLKSPCQLCCMFTCMFTTYWYLSIYWNILNYAILDIVITELILLYPYC